MSTIAKGLSLLLSLPLTLAATRCSAQQTVTLAQLTGNNTSAPSALGAMPNGNAAPGNISNVSLKKLLPPNFHGRVLAHWMPWWKCTDFPCEGSHDKRGPIRVHYSSEDSGQLDRTIRDMIQRGYDGVVVSEADTAGPDAAGAQAMAREVTKFPNFVFAIYENHLNKLKPRDQAAKLEHDMAYDQRHFFSIPNYLRINQRPVVFIFDNGDIDWARAEQQLPENPIFILNGPKYASGSIGGFFWFGGLEHNAKVSSGDELDKVHSFYSQVAGNPGRLYSGAFFKGFDDRLAPWGLGRRIDQACGLTFIRSLSAVAKYLSKSSSNLLLLQGATWNDYEEGTELETGIDNCGAVSASVSGTIVRPVPSFAKPGSEETVDHYEIYISVDGKHLIDAASIPVHGEPFDIATLRLAPGAYSVFVQMVGKSHILNQISTPVQLSIGGVSTPGHLPTGLVPAQTSEPGSESTPDAAPAQDTTPLPSASAPPPPPSSSPTITVSSPVEGAQVSNPVALSITTNEPFTVARIQVWDHGKKVLDQLNSTSVDGVSIPLALGAHTSPSTSKTRRWLPGIPSKSISRSSNPVDFCLYVPITDRRVKPQILHSESCRSPCRKQWVTETCHNHTFGLSGNLPAWRPAHVVAARKH